MTCSRLDLSRRLVRRSLGGGASPWTKEEIRQARQIHLRPVLEQLGFRLLPRPDDNYAITNLTHEIIIKDHYWNCPDTGQTGNAIDFFMKIRGVTFNEAMTLLSAHK